MAQDLAALTNMWMLNPTMFDPTQKSNQFSNFNNAPLPWPPTYNTGAAGGPVSAATGKPIQSFLDWQAANPGGMSINSTPQQAQAPARSLPALGSGARAMYDAGYGDWSMLDPMLGHSSIPGQVAGQGQNVTGGMGGATAAPQPSPPPNNWQAALNALANPGNPQTMGATVPQVSGYQPAGGVNQAFLGQAGGRPNMNQNYLSALGAIQGRKPQGM